MFDMTFAQTGMTGTQGAVLNFIYTQSKNQNVYQRDIEIEFEIRRSSVTSMVNNLEKGGFIKRERVPEDSRLKRIVLTDKAISIAEQLQNSIDEVNRAILKGLNNEEIQYLDLILTKITENLP
ncbi:MarR family winged helix-turn-helix transcriptional regulator [Gottschalkia acidurici]|nr:MarR family transcriptional regulator [Gottschalkia acidurici]